MRPSVLPLIPKASENAPFFQRPCRASATLSGIRRSSAEEEPEGELGDGRRVLAGAVGDEDAALRRARHVDRVVARAGADDEFELGVGVEIGGGDLRRADDEHLRRRARARASVSASPLSEASTVTAWPASRRRSMPRSEKESAMRTFMGRGSGIGEVEGAGEEALGSEPVDEQAAAELGLEPRRLRRHELPGVGDGEELLRAASPNIEMASCALPLSTSRSSSFVPRMPPTKPMFASVRGSVMPRRGSSRCSPRRATSSVSATVSRSVSGRARPYQPLRRGRARRGRARPASPGRPRGGRSARGAWRERRMARRGGRR